MNNQGRSGSNCKWFSATNNGDCDVEMVVPSSLISKTLDRTRSMIATLRIAITIFFSNIIYSIVTITLGYNTV